MLADNDDDDATFGDFKFASPSPEDDDWGDFVQSPLPFPPPAAAAAAADTAFDPFASFGPSTGTSSNSASESGGKKVWERPKGAIPLSVFGEELVEEESGDRELVFGGSDAFVKKDFVGQDGVCSSAAAGAAAAGGSNFADLIANLYGDAAKVEEKREAGIKVDALSNGDVIDESGWEFKGAGLLAGAHNGGVWEVDHGAVTLQNGEIKNELEVHQNHNIESSAPPNFNFQDPGVKLENGGPLDFTEEDIDFDDNDWIFKDALSDNGQQNEFFQDTKVSCNNATGTACSTNFSNGRIHSFDLFDVPNASFFEFENSTEKGLSGSTLSVDLMFGLEREDEQNSIATVTKAFQNDGFDSFQIHSKIDVDYNKNNLYERSEFKSALEVKRVEEKISKSSSHQVHNNNISIKKFDDFYNTLKEESRSLALHHLEDLKKKKVASALSEKDDEVTAMNEEIQSAYKKLQQESLASGKVHPVDLPSGNVDMLLEFVKDPDFQVLEFEYYLESQILMAKNNVNSAVCLFEHAHWMLNIMRLRSTYDQNRYVDAWSKVVLACSFELEHGSKIWKQSLQKNIQTQILMNSRGQQYFVALGEIYRIVEILRCSAIIYKPWILLNSENSENIYTCSRTCRGLWTDGGLRDALEIIADRLSNEFGTTTRTLLESINAVGNLDEVVLQNHMPDHDVPLCLLSLLSLKSVPEMKTIIWNGKQCFLTLANFWANKISSSPPHLSSAHVG